MERKPGNPSNFAKRLLYLYSCQTMRAKAQSQTWISLCHLAPNQAELVVLQMGRPYRTGGSFSWRTYYLRCLQTALNCQPSFGTASTEESLPKVFPSSRVSPHPTTDDIRVQMPCSLTSNSTTLKGHPSFWTLCGFSWGFDWDCIAVRGKLESGLPRGGG